MRSLNPTTPALPIGVFRHFRAAASVQSVTSPNKLQTRRENNHCSGIEQKVMGGLPELNRFVGVSLLLVAVGRTFFPGFAGNNSTNDHPGKYYC
jgi:hypothetical protein